MKKIELFKGAVGFVTSVGVGTIVKNAIRLTTPPAVNALIQVCIGVGSFVMTCMVSDKATAYTEEKIDEAVEAIKSTISEETEE